jgi:uracil-DNA glycosylase
MAMRAARSAAAPASRGGPYPGEDKRATDLAALRHDAAECRACPLWEKATGTVFGEGPAAADLVLVGEQPGDEEDRQGRPFVGPAGKVLDRALGEAGIERSAVYITNAVKHFKFVQRGKRRLHERPSAGEVTICRWWLSHELALIRPQLVMALGATALRGLTGRSASLGPLRGRTITTSEGLPLVVTVHPSLILRLPDPAARAHEYRRFVDDLRHAGAIIRG